MYTVEVCPRSAGVPYLKLHLILYCTVKERLSNYSQQESDSVLQVFISNCSPLGSLQCNIIYKGYSVLGI